MRVYPSIRGYHGRFVILGLVVLLASAPSNGLAQAAKADLNGDGVVNVLDASIVSTCIGQDPGAVPECAVADTDGDGDVDLADLQFVADHFGQTVPTGDDVAPSLIITSPQAVQPDPSVTVVVEYADDDSGVDLQTLEVVLDGTAVSTCDVGPAVARCPAGDLDGGDHRVETRVSDNAGNTAEAALDFRVLLDEAQPVINIVSPAKRDVLIEAIPDIVVTYTDDDSGIDVQSLEIELDGQNIVSGCTVEPARATCPSPALSAGAHNLIARVSDHAGVLATKSFGFNVLADEDPPLLTIAEPASSRLFGVTVPEVRVAYADPRSGVALSTLVVELDGTAITNECQLGASSADCGPRTLTAGRHSLSAAIEDNLGNEATVTVNFELSVELPVTITDPADGFLTRDNTVSVQGTAAFADSVTINGIPASLAGDAFVLNALPLREGANIISVVARNANGAVGTANTTVVRDTTAPRVVITSPPGGFVTTSSQLIVAGEVVDSASSNFAAREMRVTVNGVSAPVTGRTFIVPELLLQPGVNRITATSEDSAGNFGTAAVEVRLVSNVVQKIVELQGNSQRARIRETLPGPLVVRLTNPIGGPLPNRRVQFAVTRGDGVVMSFPEAAQSLIVQTDEQGIAQVRFALGGRAGEGNHEVTVTSPGFTGAVIFCASADAGPPTFIKSVPGNNQTGARTGIVSKALPKPLLTQVFDNEGNPAPGVEVIYEAIEGGGRFAGLPAASRTTDAEGKAAAIVTLGPREGVNNNVIQARFDGLTGPPATFPISAKAPANEAGTQISGLILDNQDDPVPGVTVHVDKTTLFATSDAQGRFVIPGAPVGAVGLEVDGSTTPRPGRWPVLHFEFTTISGRDNDLGMPIRLLPLNEPGAKIVGGAQDVTLTMDGIPGVELTVFANSVTFPDGSKTGELLFTQVHADKVPMVAPLGSNFMLAWTIQPAGVSFDPPARVAIPNLSGDGPGTHVEMFSFDHDLGEFVSIGPATITPDGLQVRSDPGFGVLKSGWGGCVTPPDAPTDDACKEGVCTTCSPSGTTVSRCSECEVCTGSGCEPRKLEKVVAKGKGGPADRTMADFKEDQVIVGIEQPALFRAEVLEGDCPGGKTTFEWDFGDGSDTEEGQEVEHEYEEAGTFNAEVTAKCDCPGVSDVTDKILVRVIDLGIEGRFKMITMETLMDVIEDDEDGDGKNDNFFRVLGGARIKLNVDAHPVLAGKTQKYTWSTDLGHFFAGFEISSVGLVGPGLEGPDKREIFWESSSWAINLDGTIELTVTLTDNQIVIGKRRAKTRLLEQGVDDGDDVKMLQSVLRLLGLSQNQNPTASGNRFGWAGTAVVVDGNFGPGTGRAVTRFQTRDEIGADGKVGSGTLAKLEDHWLDYQWAIDAHPMDTTVNFTHPSLNAWVTATATSLGTVYTDAIQGTVRPGVAGATGRFDLVDAWARKESGAVGHWGRNIDFRIILGGFDNAGSIGFSQIVNRHKYGSSPIGSIQALNLYEPMECMVGFAVFSNSNDAKSGGGGGFRRAYVDGTYTATENFTGNDLYPTYHIQGQAAAASYTDDNKDLLSKAVMAYNRGSGLTVGYGTNTWPEFIERFAPPTAGTGFGTRTAMEYTLIVQSNGNVPDRCWTWTDIVITTGADGTCDSAPGVAPTDQVLATTVPNGVCIRPMDPGVMLATMPAGDDQQREFSFDFCESDWRGGTSWDAAWNNNLPAVIP